MGLFGLFGKKEIKKSPKGFHLLKVLNVHRETSDTVKIEFDIPADLRKNYQFKAGQYIDVNIDVDGKDERRSYSICSGKNEPLAIAVKEIANGKVSKWFNQNLEAGTEVSVSEPKGNFTLQEDAKNVVAIAAGSGITPILAIAKDMETKGGNLRLFYGNRTVESIIFKKELDALKNTFTTHFLSQENVEGFENGRITKDHFTEIIKNDLSLLRADAYFICGPEELIIHISDTLKFFGVNEKKIHFELFTPPVLMKQEEVSTSEVFEGVSKVKVFFDGDVVEFDLDGKGKTLLEAATNEGIDAPYSCKGGVCCSCKAKVLKGSARMKMNYSLTDEEVKEGYILTCQAHPTSDTLTITFDE